ncbi:MAG TPA: anhydro-N-acetylmuramic acid kinase [Cytophagales bacterium]|nr:anhydro-N-acetylmuramic acid kinase [Cytophagales bacterium]
MNQNIQKLYKIAKKKERKIIGLMSGTSLDGLDVALCRFKGSGLETEASIDFFDTIPYDESIKSKIRKVFAKEQVELQHLCLLNPWIGSLHGEMILQCLKKWKISPSEVDLIASHGQTIFHAPSSFHKLENFPNSTLQIGDGDHIAIKTGIITFSDFRQKHVAGGGEGAPLAVYGDFLLFSKKDEDRIMLNIGGIANFTYLSGDLDATKMYSTDVGPGNTLIDAFTRIYFPGKNYDENGQIASEGTVHPGLLGELKSSLFFDAEIPKTTGPELFSINYVKEAQRKSNTEDLSGKDLIATLTLLSAEGIADSIKKKFKKNIYPVIYLSGGGMHNSTLVKMIKELLPGAILKTTQELSIQPDAKEAVLFAVLANESVAAGKPSLGAPASLIPDVFMGKVSFPI